MNHIYSALSCFADFRLQVGKCIVSIVNLIVFYRSFLLCIHSHPRSCILHPLGYRYKQTFNRICNGILEIMVMLKLEGRVFWEQHCSGKIPHSNQSFYYLDKCSWVVILRRLMFSNFRMGTPLKEDFHCKFSSSEARRMFGPDDLW